MTEFSIYSIGTVIQATGSRTQENNNLTMAQSTSTVVHYPDMHNSSMHNRNKLDDSVLISSMCLDLTGASIQNISECSDTNFMQMEEELCCEKPSNPHTLNSSNLHSEISFNATQPSGVSSTSDTYSQRALFSHNPSSSSDDLSVESSDLTTPTSQNSIVNVTSIYSSTVPSVPCLQNISLGGHTTVVNSSNLENVKVGVVGKSCVTVSHSVDPPKSNITSMYTRRSSPLNSSLNSIHCFDPALPLPKRLTESIQKLVKPLMTLDSATSCQRKSPISCIPKIGTLTTSPSKGNPRLGSCSASRYSGTCVGGSVPSYDLPLPVSSSLLGSGCKMVGNDSTNCEDLLPGISLSPLSSMSGEICVNEPACSSSVVPLSSSQSTITAPIITSAAHHAAHVSNIYSFAANSLQSSHKDKLIVSSTSSVSQPSQSFSVQRIISEPEHHSMVPLSCQTYIEKMCSPEESNVFESANELASNVNCDSLKVCSSREQVESEAPLCTLSTQQSPVHNSITHCIAALVGSAVHGEPLHRLSETETDTVANGTSGNVLDSTCGRSENSVDKASGKVSLSGKCADKQPEVEQCSLPENESNIAKTFDNVKEQAIIPDVLVNTIVDEMNTCDKNYSAQSVDSNNFSIRVIESKLVNNSKEGHVHGESRPLVNSMEHEKATSLSISVEESQHPEIDHDVKSQRLRRTSESSDGSMQSSSISRVLRACRRRVSSAEHNPEDDPEVEKSQRYFRKRKTLNDSENNTEFPEEKLKIDSENFIDSSSIMNLKKNHMTFEKCMKEECDFTRICDRSGRCESQTLIDTVKSGLRVRSTVRSALTEDIGKTNASSKDTLTKDLKRESRTPLNKFISEKGVKTTEDDVASRRAQMNRRGRQTDKSVACSKFHCMTPSYFTRNAPIFIGL